MKKVILIFLFCFSAANVSPQEPKVSTGSLQRFSNFESQFVDARNIDVWLPEGYSDKEKYAVLYMHDGQMLYDVKTTWNKQTWDLDSIAGKLMAENKTKKFIVVGIWNNGKKRHPEYFPQKPYENLTSTEKDFVSNELKQSDRNNEIFNPISDNYLKFLVQELKPFIDKTFSTKKNKEPKLK